jgi:streptogramin lyase
MFDLKGNTLRQSLPLLMAIAGTPSCDRADDSAAAAAAVDVSTAPAAHMPAAAAPAASLWVVIDRLPGPGDSELVQAVSRLDAATGTEADRITEIGYNPAEPTYVDGVMCVHNIGYSSVTCVDPTTHAIVRTYEFGNGFVTYHRTAGTLLATEIATGLLRIDPATGDRQLLSSEVEPRRYASAAGALWVITAGMGIRRLDPTTGATIATVPPMVDGELYMPLDIAATAEAAWATTSSGHVLRIDAASNTITAVIDGAATPSETQVLLGGKTRIVADAAAAWVVGLDNGTILRIDATSNEAAVAGPLAPPVRDIAVGHGAVWVLHGTDGRVSRLDPATGSAAVVASVGRGAVGLVAH